jgi:hypothetical protein
MASARLGIKSGAYLNSGSYGSPTWTLVTCISDLSVKPAWKEADGSTRASRLELSVKTMLGLQITGKIRADSGDTNWTSIMAALLSDSPLDMMILNGLSTVNGTIGYRCDFQLYDASEDQGLNAVVFDDIMLKPTVSANSNYQTVLVTTGAPVFTAI